LNAQSIALKAQRLTALFKYYGARGRSHEATEHCMHRGGAPDEFFGFCAGDLLPRLRGS